VTPAPTPCVPVGAMSTGTQSIVWGAWVLKGKSHAPWPNRRALAAPSLSAVRPGPSATVAAVALGWGSIGVIVRQVDLPAVAIVASRVGVAALALGAWLAWRRPTDGPRLLRYRPGRTLATGALLAGHWLALFAAYRRAPIGTVLLITYLAPVGVAALAPRALDEKVSRGVILALGLAVAGVALVVGPAPGGSASGLALAGIAAASYTVLVLASKPLAEAYGGVRLAFIEMAVATVVLLPLAATASWGAPEPSWLWLLVLGVVHTAAAIGLYLAALARMPATQAAILAYLEPAAAVLFAWGFLDEQPNVGTLLGGVLIVAAGVLVVRAGALQAVPAGEVTGVPG
jgi:drug/metabolite transporter (DMT)-like permease